MKTWRFAQGTSRDSRGHVALRDRTALLCSPYVPFCRPRSGRPLSARDTGVLHGTARAWMWAGPEEPGGPGLSGRSGGEGHPEGTWEGGRQRCWNAAAA